jgi:hypothetical protein
LLHWAWVELNYRPSDSPGACNALKSRQLATIYASSCWVTNRRPWSGGSTRIWAGAGTGSEVVEHRVAQHLEQVGDQLQKLSTVDARAAGNAFRTFVHPVTRIEALVRAARFQVLRSRSTLV